LKSPLARRKQGEESQRKRRGHDGSGSRSW
jgi:hypothetical protein